MLGASVRGWEARLPGASAAGRSEAAGRFRRRGRGEHAGCVCRVRGVRVPGLSAGVVGEPGRKPGAISRGAGERRI